VPKDLEALELGEASFSYFFLCLTQPPIVAALMHPFLYSKDLALKWQLPKPEYQKHKTTSVKIMFCGGPA
jgi:hypothetical protein